MNVVLLAGGTGGAKLAVGLRDVLHGYGDSPAEPAGSLTVVANTADDIEIYGVHVSPDPDLVTYRLANVIGEHGFGIAGEGHTLMDARRQAGEDVWFELGDEDIAVCAARARLLAAGEPLTTAHAAATADYDTGGVRVLPMCDEPVRTVIDTPSGPRGIQQFLIQDHGAAPISAVRYEGIERASATADVIAAIEAADLVLVGPSNPVISVMPILDTPGLSEALERVPAALLAVSPLVSGEVLKGPTAEFVRAAGFESTSSGIAEYYEAHHPSLIDAWIADEPVRGFAHVLADVEMTDPEHTRAVAAEVLRYGSSLAAAGRR